jgi:hypothetical protein
MRTIVRVGKFSKPFGSQPQAGHNFVLRPRMQRQERTKYSTATSCARCIDIASPPAFPDLASWIVNSNFATGYLIE